MSEPAYGEPWSWLNARLDNSTPSPGLVRLDISVTFMSVTLRRGVIDVDREHPEKYATRMQNCVNLLQNVPDDAPCFGFTKHSYAATPEIALALAVLEGRHGAAAGLADEITERYGRMAREFHDGEEIVAFYEERITALAEECVARVTERRAQKALETPLGKIFPPLTDPKEVARDALMSIIRAKMLGPAGLRGVTDLGGTGLDPTSPEDQPVDPDEWEREAR